jgi:hypothetical protein
LASFLKLSNAFDAIATTLSTKNKREFTTNDQKGQNTTPTIKKRGTLLI